MSGCFIVSRNDGLGARLLPILSAMRLGVELDVPVKVLWPILLESQHNTADFETLFSREFLDRCFVDAAEYDRLNTNAMPIEVSKHKTRAELKDAVNTGTNFAFTNTVTKIRLADEDEETVNTAYAAAMSEISFSPVVTEHMARIDAAFQGRKTIAYHVRHGDLTSHYRTSGKPWTAKYIPNEFYLEHIRAAASSDALTVMFGDCAQSLEWMKDNHPDLYLITDLVPLDGINALQRDFLELYAMSRTGEIVAPKMSGFSQMAAGIGAIPVHDIVEVLSDDQMRTACEALAARIRDDRDSFTGNGDIGQSLAHLVPWLASHDRTDQAINLLEGELAAGNRTPFLYQLRAQLAHKDGDAALLAKLSFDCRDEMVFERSVPAEIDAMHADLEIGKQNYGAALPLLRRALTMVPFGTTLRNAMSEICTLDNLNTSGFFPFEKELLQSSFLVRGKTPLGTPAIDMRMFAWDARYYFMSPMTRTLTIGGLGGRALATIDKAIDALSGSDDPLLQSFQSFRTVIEMEVGDKNAALASSAKLAAENPDRRFILQRHLMNLLAVKQTEAALEVAEQLTALEPDALCYQGVLGDIYYDLKLFPQALACYERVNPGKAYFPAFVTRHAFLLRRAKRLDEAKAMFDSCLAETGWLDRYIVEQTRMTLPSGRASEYLPRMERLSREGGALRKVQNMIARIRFKEGDIDQALEYAELAVKYSPRSIDYVTFLVQLYLEIGNLKQAEDLLTSSDMQISRPKFYADFQTTLAEKHAALASAS